MDVNAKKIKDLHEVRKLLVEEIKFLKNAKEKKTKLSLGGHIAAWEGFLHRIDSVLLGHPEDAIQSVDGWKVGDVFILDEFKGVLYKIKTFIDHKTISAETTSYHHSVPNFIQRPLSLCKKVFKSEEEEDQHITKKRKKAKKEKNKAPKQFKLGTSTKEKKKSKNKAKNKPEQGFKFKKKKNKKK